MAEYKNLPLRMAHNGRLSIPARQRKELGLEKGGVVVSTVENGELRIRTMKAVLAELQNKVAGLLANAGLRPGTLLSEELVVERKAEAERQEREQLGSSQSHARGS